MVTSVRHVVQKIGPCSFRLSVAIARILSFNVEMDSHGQDASEIMPDPFRTERSLPDRAREGVKTGDGLGRLDSIKLPCIPAGTHDNFTLFEGQALEYSREIQQPCRPTPTSSDQPRHASCTNDQHRPRCNSFTPRRSSAPSPTSFKPSSRSTTCLHCLCSCEHFRYSQIARVSTARRRRSRLARRLRRTRAPSGRLWPSATRKPGHGLRVYRKRAG